MIGDQRVTSDHWAKAELLIPALAITLALAPHQGAAADLKQIGTD